MEELEGLLESVDVNPHFGLEILVLGLEALTLGLGMLVPGLETLTLGLGMLVPGLETLTLGLGMPFPRFEMLAERLLCMYPNVVVLKLVSDLRMVNSGETTLEYCHQRPCTFYR